MERGGAVGVQQLPRGEVEQQVTGGGGGGVPPVSWSAVRLFVVTHVNFLSNYT